MNFFKSLLTEGTATSSKRWISVTVSAVICYGIVVVIHKYPNLIEGILRDAMVFVSIMSGVATVAQVASIFKGTPDNSKQEEKEEIKSKIE